MNPAHLPFSVHVTVKSLEDTVAVLETEEKYEIRWPKSKLPADIAVGVKLQLTIVNDALTAQEREKVAKQILNEILHTNGDNS